MNAIDYFEVVTDYAVFHPIGEVTLAEGVELITSGITLARTQKIRKLLVLTSGLTGFPTPSVADRFFFVLKWAEAAGRAVRVAVVARPEMIDSQKFGVLVGDNRGLINDVFTSEEDALAWLQQTL